MPARHGLAALTRDIGEPRRRSSRSRCTPMAAAAYRRFASRAAPPLERDVVPHAGAARQSRVRARGIFAARRTRPIRACTLRLSYDPGEDVAAPYIASGARPAVAILREQGVNSQTEMAAVFTRAGFDAYDVHMTDILSGRARAWRRFHGLVACGGFSYGDVLGAGEAGRNRSCSTARAREEFAAFFARTATFTLGVCNGCQMLSALQGADPGRRALAALRAQSIGAIRGAPGAGARAAFAVGAVGGHARLGVADRGGPWRGPGRVRSGMRPPQSCSRSAW